jgi:RNA polymerase sigma-70 factor (ECF subfamily)
MYPGQYRLLPVRANGIPAVAVYRQADVGGQHRAAAIMLVFVQHGRIAQLVRFAAPTLFPSFGLPLELGRAE